MTDKEILEILSRIRRAVEAEWKETGNDELHDAVKIIDRIEDAIVMNPEYETIKSAFRCGKGGG